MQWEWLLPINCILLYVGIRLFSRKKVDRDLSLGITVCLLTFTVLASTELLSLFRALSRRSLILLWGGLDALLVLAIFVMFVMLARKERCLHKDGIRALMLRAQTHWLRSLAALAMFVAMVVMGAISVRLAAQTVPYNWDSMTYHLGRVAHWYQNGSVAHYASNIDRQILSPALGEFWILQVYILAGGSDRSVNLVQCAAYLLCAILVARLARRLGVRHWMACLSGVLFMTMPIAFAESLTTQNDLVSCVYLLIFVTMAMDLWQQDGPIVLVLRGASALGDTTPSQTHNLVQILCMGLCIGYGYLVKPSVCLGMVIFLIPVLTGCWRRRDSIGVVIGSMFVAGVVAAAVAAPELARMYGTYHAFSNSQAGARQMVGSADPRMLILNLCKSVAFNLPNAWMPGLSDGITVILYGIAAVFGVDLNDPAISEDGRTYGLSAVNDYAHDTAVNAVIFWLWIVCLLFLVISLIVRHARRQKDLETMCVARVYIRTTIVAFVFFWLVVRWEPYEVRYMLPYLALICVAVPLALELILSRMVQIEQMQVVLAALAVLALIPTCLTARQMAAYHTGIATSQGDRPDGYYYYAGENIGAQYNLATAVQDAGYTTVGLHCGGDYYEYPLWYWLGGVTEIEHVLVENETAQYEDEAFQPDCILFLKEELPAEYDSQGYLSYHGSRYTVSVRYDDNHLLLVRE